MTRRHRRSKYGITNPNPIPKRKNQQEKLKLDQENLKLKREQEKLKCDQENFDESEPYIKT